MLRKINNSAIFWIIGVVLVATFIVLGTLSPKTSNNPPTVTRYSQIKYEIGEKVLVNPYGSWIDGEIKGVTSEDNYIVQFCGNIGWAHKWECVTDDLLRSQLAKIK